MTDKEISQNIGISQETFYQWTKLYSEFSEAIKKGRQPVNLIVEKTFFEEKLKGRTVKEKTTEKTIHRDADGNIVSSSEHIRTTERYIPADTTAMLFYMKCRMPEKYNDKINVAINNQPETEPDNFLEALNGTAAADWEEEQDDETTGEDSSV